MYRDNDGWTEAEYESKIVWSAQMVRSIRSRVWGFQELWHIDAITEVFDRAGLLDQYDILAPEGHTGTEIVCAAAVEKGLLQESPVYIDQFDERFKLQSSGDDPQSPDISVALNKFSRPALKFKIRPRSNGEPITVYVAHLKSKRPTELYREGWYREDSDFYKRHATAIGYAISSIRRVAEAAALRMYIIEEIKNTDIPVVVMGDLNDGELGDTLNTLTGQPNYLLSGLSQGGSDTGLYSVGTLQEYRSLQSVYYTHIHQNIKESLDHILVSQEFYDNSRKRIWAFKGMEIANDHLNNDEHKPNGTSDHGIVKAIFEYRPI